MFTFIISTYNRSAYLKNFLDYFLAQEIPQEFSFEILMIDNNSKDDTRETIEQYMNKFPLGALKYIFENRQGKCYALNTAIIQAKGDILVFTDDDVILPKDWFKNINKFVTTVDFDAACGRVLVQYEEGIPTWIKDNNDLISGPIVSYDYGTETIPHVQNKMLSLIGANLIVKRQLFNESGLYNTNLGPGTGTMGDDTEMCIRWEKMNKKLYYVGNILVWHPALKNRANLKYIADWNLAYGRYEVIKYKWKLPDNTICYAGVPRYLIRCILLDFIKSVLNILNKREFLKSWVSLYRDLGRAQEYRQHQRVLKNQN